MYYNANDNLDRLNNIPFENNSSLEEGMNNLQFNVGEVNNNNSEYLDVDADSENVNEEFNNTSSFLTELKGFNRNSLKSDRTVLKNNNYEDNSTIERKRGSLMDELKTKLPKMVPKNMMNE